MIARMLNIVHPYPKYGLAAAVYHQSNRLNDLQDDDLRLLLIEAIERGLEHFRMKTDDMPGLGQPMTYHPIKATQLTDEPKLVQSAGLAARGVFLFPTIVTTDGDAKGTYDNASTILKDLKSGRGLDTAIDLSRSYAPTTAKINNGKRSQSPPRSTLFEAACSVITTLTPVKPAAWINQRNTVILPDLEIEQLCGFIELFEKMAATENIELLASSAPKSTDTRRAKPEKKSEFQRPPMFHGNYPYAPQRDAATFGPVGLLGAIGYWAHRYNQLPWADKVLSDLAGRPLYIISYDSISQVHFSHHVTDLAREGKLSEIVNKLAYETRLGEEIDEDRPLWSDPKRQLFHLATSRFLQLFTLPAFRDFLAMRTAYPAETQILFERYFMNEASDRPLIDRSIVEAAGVLGQWLNRVAYFAAYADVSEKKADRDKEVRKAKAKIIVTFESVAMSARDPLAMISQVISQAGRLGQGDVPDEAKPFLDAAMIGPANGGITAEQARHLLMVYMRLRSSATKDKESDISPASDYDLNG
ncbi:hypothetical protein CCAX7_61880 [Capsulimonas corticalis]|uniref:Uncharacterized protein n=2 Tax=Capsulimonas corticalis TaxID=2219043 RepID=A0A402CWG3_9BACT|nr:hypothetical protein CCAX7_61880 [Capsulimonas corticalis]